MVAELELSEGTITTVCTPVQSISGKVHPSLKGGHDESFHESIHIQNSYVFCLAVSIASTTAHAQVTSTSGSAATSWGGWNWQADRAPITLTVTGSASFSTPPGLVQIPVNIASGITVHEVHGNFTLATWQGGTCGNGSIIAQLRDQSGNALAAVKLQQFRDRQHQRAFTGTFATPVNVTSLQIQYFVDLCGPQTVQFSLILN